MIGQPACHRWRLLDGRVLAAVVVKREVQAECRFVVLPFLAVRIGQSGHAANRHTERQIRPFNVRSANRIRIRVATAVMLRGADESRRRVPARIAGLLIVVILDQLCEVHAVAKHVRDRSMVRPQPSVYNWNRPAVATFSFKAKAPTAAARLKKPAVFGEILRVSAVDRGHQARDGSKQHKRRQPSGNLLGCSCSDQ